MDTCLKSHVLCNDVMLAKWNKMFFKKWHPFNLNDYDHVINSMLKTICEKQESKQTAYHQYKNIELSNLWNDLEYALAICGNDINR